MTTTTLHGDCTDLLPTLALASVQCIVTSPPYFGLRDYGITPTAWPAIEYTPMPGLPPITIPSQTVCLGLEADPLAYAAHLVHVFRLARPALRDDGVAFLNLGDSYAGTGKSGGGAQGDRWEKGGMDVTGPRGSKWQPAPAGLKQKDLMMIPARVAMALQADGWYVRSQVIWHKSNAMPESVTDRPTNDYEPVYLLAKSPRYYYDADAIREPHITESNIRNKANEKHNSAVLSPIGKGEREWNHPNGRNRRAVWRISTESLRDEHYAPMPQALVEPCILAGSRPGDTVLDPFAGSGTVLRVAERLQRDSIGIDLNADYIELQQRRTNGVQVELFV